MCRETKEVLGNHRFEIGGSGKTRFFRKREKVQLCYRCKINGASDRRRPKYKDLKNKAKSTDSLNTKLKYMLSPIDMKVPRTSESQ